MLGFFIWRQALKPLTLDERPNYVEVADHFYNDSVDFLLRYRICIKSDEYRFDTPFSRRIKCFIDLRMAMESILKGYACYNVHSELSGKDLIRRIEKYSHHVNKLFSACQDCLPMSVKSKVGVYCEQLSKLPVGLRYKLDAADFKSNRTKKYNETIGDIAWLDNLAEIIDEITKLFGKELNKESRLVGLDDIISEMLDPSYSKYQSKDS